jgi:hypothetical protein
VNATAKFYAGFFVALALVVALAFYAGYRTGYGRAIYERTHAHATP